MNIKTVYFEITNRCNLNCKTCYNRSGLNTTTKEISVEQLEKTILAFHSYGASRFLFSGGEPTLHSQFHEILLLTKRYPNFSYGFVTNGTVHDPIWIHYLNAAKNVTLQISLDGINEAQNAQIRGLGNFDKTINFVKQIHNPNLKPLLKMVVTRDNLNGVEDFYKMAIELGCIPEYAFIYKSGNAEEDWNYKLLSAQQKIHVLKVIDQLNQTYRVDAFLPKCTVSCPFIKSVKDLSLCVKKNGSIQPCQSLYDSVFSLGNIFDFQEQYFMSRIAQIAQMAQERAACDFGCKKCMLQKVCGRGCMAEAYLLKKSYLANDDNCTYRKLLLLEYEIRKQQEAHE